MKKQECKLFIISILLVLVSCNKSKTETEDHLSTDKVTINNPYLRDSTSMISIHSSLTREIITQGSTEAYDNLYNLYMDNSQDAEMLPYALIMANKYNYPFAYYDVFELILIASKMYQNQDDLYNLTTLDPQSRQIALSYLMKAYVRGSNNAKNIITEYIEKGGYSFSDTTLYKKELMIK